MHIPVLADKVLEFLQPEENRIYVDATLGCGGHTIKIFEKCSNCKVIGIELDSEAIEFAKQRLKNFVFENKLTIVKENFINIKKILENLNIEKVDGVIFDFGLSMLQLRSKRGFSFNDDTLDMRFDPSSNPVTASYVLNNFSEKQLSEIFYKYGQEKKCSLIAKKIVEYRKHKKITKAKELTEIVTSVIKRKDKKNLYLSNKETLKIKFNPATKIFQALRIYVNNELENIEKGLDEAIDVLKPKGKVIALSYHSLEDRIIKNKFKARGDCIVLTKKPITPDVEEIKNNLSARSAKLRVAEKI
ncbi:MAG: 16S rRNA (cytosine(1402)-N(4))-methyltransferase RsmH [Endomicrobiia bacterium]